MSRCHPFALMTFSGLATSKSRSTGIGSFSVSALPTDPLGAFSLTLTNLVIGSAVQIEATDGTPLENRTVATTTEVFVLSAYAAGAPLNNLRIKVRKGSAAPYYQPWETLATATPGSASIYVSQIPDE